MDGDARTEGLQVDTAVLGARQQALKPGWVRPGGRLQVDGAAHLLESGVVVAADGVVDAEGPLNAVFLAPGDDGDVERVGPGATGGAGAVGDPRGVRLGLVPGPKWIPGAATGVG